MRKLPPHLFVSSSDGGLYDTRKPSWHKAPALRAIYCRTFREISNTMELRATIRNGAFAWPGGYPMYFITSDGAALSFDTVQKKLRQIAWSIRHKSNDGWRVVGCDINYEDGELTDAHTGARIESAYAE